MTSGRVALFRACMAGQMDAAVVTSLPNIRYLTGFSGSNAALIVASGSLTLFTDPRYTIQAAAETRLPVKTVTGPLLHAVCGQLAKLRARRIGFEDARIGYAAAERLRAGIPPRSKLLPLGGSLEALRMVKSPEEVEAIRASVRLNSEAFEQALAAIHPDQTEAGLALEIDYRMRKLGATGPAFDTIVAAGPRAALPHARPTPAPFGKRSLLLIDMGATVEAYASDMTRMVHLGRPSRLVRQVYAAVLEAQLAAIDAIRPGIPGGRVDRAARQVLTAQGLGAQFVHSTGHGLGLEIHEGPRLGKSEKTKLEEGMVVTVEPGVYLEGSFGIRIEDTVLVTKTGCEVLTPTPKTLRLV
jgi:Xaa-Pro aminopeptidase